MKKHNVLLMVLLLAVLFVSAFPQGTPPAQPHPQQKRTTTKTDRFDFGVGGTVSVAGAPTGSIRIEGWKNREVEITAEIEVQGNSEEDLVKLGAVTTFVLDETLGRANIMSVGTYDKKYMKNVAKKFPKQLLAMPTKIDYVIHVPQYTDLLIDGGHGDLSITGVEGTFKLNYIETNAHLSLVGGSVTAVFGAGNVEVVIPRSNWRGRFADISLAAGEMNVVLPHGMNAELDATILRTGKIENEFAGLKPRVRKDEFTDKLIVARSGVGGIPLKFTVGDGTLKLSNVGG